MVRVSGTTETSAASTTTTTVTVPSLTADTTYTFAVYAKDAAGNRSPRSATVTVRTEKGTGTPGAGCSVRYRVIGEWPGGFQGEITIGNTGTTAISGWTLGFSFPNGQTISTMWGGTPAQSGAAVTVAAASYTSTVPAGGSVTVGFTGSRSTANTSPTAFTLNGTACTTG